MEPGRTAVGPSREDVLLALAKRDKSDVPATLRAITEAAAVALDVARVGVWRLLPDGSGIVCEDAFLRDEGLHERGTTVFAKDCPAYIQALARSRTIAAHDACVDPRTRELAPFYLRPLGITSLLDVPIWHAGRTYGVICHEHIGPARRWTEVDEAFAGNMSDITSLSLEAGEHRAAERRWAAVANAITEAVFVFDEAGRIVTTNPTAARMLERAGVGTEPAGWGAAVELRDATGRALSPGGLEWRRGLVGTGASGEVLQVFTRRTGELRTYRVTLAPLREEGQVRSVVAVLSDLTDQAHHERLNRELLAALAHELKTPVAITKGYAQHLAREPELPVAWRPMLGAVDRAANRMQRLIEDLITVSELMLGTLVLAPGAVDLAALAQKVVRTAGKGPGGQRLHVQASGDALVHVDPERVEQLVRRLVDNALRYSPGGGDVDVTVTPEQGAVVLSVRDRGIGIPAAKQGRMFEAFFRAHAGTAYDTGGLGIGLFIARQVSRQHGGDLWFESVEGVGSTFHLRLPRAEAP